MEIIKWMIKVFSWPILLMNTVGGIASGLWLILLGRWADVGLGILVLMAGGFLLWFAILPGIIFAVPAMYFQRKAIRSGMLFFTFLSVAYTMLVITMLVFSYLFYLRDTCRLSRIADRPAPLVLWRRDRSARLPRSKGCRQRVLNALYLFRSSGILVCDRP